MSRLARFACRSWHKDLKVENMKKIVVLTGAGMSAESGLSTFRDADGLWENYPVSRVATHEAWEQDPDYVNDFYNMLRVKLVKAKPNRGHELVADTASNKDNVDLTSVAGTYEGTLPAADCPGIKTVLTINTDSTYLLKQDYIDKKDGHDEASGIFKVLDGKVLMLVRPSTGEQTFYKVKNANSIIMTDSMGVEPEGETAKLYVLKKK